RCLKAMIARHDPRRLDHRVQQVANFGAAAARQDRDDSRTRWESMAFQRLVAGLDRGDPIEQRMSYERNALTRAMEQFGLEWQHHREPIGAIDQLVDSAAPPRPHLRRDIVEHRYTVAAGSAGENQVELRVVDEDREVGLLLPDDSAQRAKRADGATNRRGQFRK